MKMLARPVKTSVVDKEIEFVKVSASKSGSRVPKSPKAPETSASGRVRKVRKLCFCDGMKERMLEV